MYPCVSLRSSRHTAVRTSQNENETSALQTGKLKQLIPLDLIFKSALQVDVTSKGLVDLYRPAL